MTKTNINIVLKVSGLWDSQCVFIPQGEGREGCQVTYRPFDDAYIYHQRGLPAGCIKVTYNMYYHM